MRLHPHTDVDGALKPYFKYPDSMVKWVCQLTYHQFAYYLHQSNPGMVDCPGAISSYSKLLFEASRSKEFIARLDKLSLDATDLIKTLQCLCCSPQNRQHMIENSYFQKATTNLLLTGEEKETECVLTLLLACLTECQPITLARKKGKKEFEERLIEDSREQAKMKLLSCIPEVIHQLESLLASQYESVKKLCSAVLWRLQADPG